MNKAFTLIELMIVIAIIGILAAVAIPQFMYARKKAQLAACESNMRSTADATSLFYSDHGRYPDDTDI